MKITATETELLELLDKTEQEHHQYFGSHYILLGEWGSIADLAEMLWHRAKMVEGFCDVVIMVLDYEMDLTIEPQDTDAWWAFDSKPIHRIVSALIALKRAGVDL